MFFDFIPLIAFFLAFQGAAFFPANFENFLSFLGFSTLLKEQIPILIATFTIIVVTFLQILYLFFKKQKISKMLLASFFLLLFFGCLTLFLQNPAFIKAKPSVLYILFALVFLLGLLFKKDPLKKLLGAQMELPPSLWKKLNGAWCCFFLLMAILNALVALYFSTAFWVNFKLLGTILLTFLFVLGQGLFLSPYLKNEKNKKE